METSEPSNDTLDTKAKGEYANWYWIMAVVVVFLIIFYVLGTTFWESHRWIVETIQIVWGSASLFGLGMAVIQVHQANARLKVISNVSEATQRAVENNKKELKQLLNVSDIGHLIEKIRHAQSQIRQTDYSNFVQTMQGIKDEIVRFRPELEEMKIAGDKLKFVVDINQDLQNVTKFLIRRRENKKTQNTLDLPLIHQHLEESREMIIILEQKIKKSII